MELTASAVNWANFQEVVNNDQLSDILFEEIEYQKELIFNETPWPSDSAQEYIEVASLLQGLAKQSKEMSLIANELINEDFSLPNELETEAAPELVSGSISPESVDKYNKLFGQLDMSDLNESVRSCLNQWANLFKFSSKHNAGIYFQLG